MTLRIASLALFSVLALLYVAGCSVYDADLLRQTTKGSGDASIEAGDAGMDGATGTLDGDVPSCIVQAQGALEYHFCPTGLTWEEARSACLDIGGDLAQVRDATENDRITRDLMATSWIGLRRSESQDVWLWASSRVPVWRGAADGEPIAGRYMAWGDGYPDGSGDCGEVTTEGLFQSADCTARKPYVCEITPDGCPDDPEKTEPGQCGCGEPDTDADGDAFAACNDSCDDDPDKLVPGICGCGVPDVDEDGDGEVDCDDLCPTDPEKNAPGICGCGVADTDSDGDNNPDCTDGCVDDPGKVEPGVCGCGQTDADSDGDGTPDCTDSCPSDPDKTEDDDSDGDGAPDCMDGCPSDPGVTSPCFPFTPTNIDTDPLSFTDSPDATLDGCGNGTTTVTTSAGGASFDNWCGMQPSSHVQAQDGAGDIVVIPLRGLTIGSGHRLRLLGTRPVVFAVRGSVNVAGEIDASGNGTTPGAGGNQSCSDSRGGNGIGNTGRWDGASGGGGGGFGTRGGTGGTADTDGNGGGPKPGGGGGDTRGNSSLSPLWGGCAGGRGGGCSTDGGGGGGAVQISASNGIDISGAVRTNGGHGARPCGANDEGGGTGGGSGGGILVEATSVDTSESTLQANGGNGGRNGEYAGIYHCGGSNGGAGSSNPSSPGGNGISCQGGGSGGGGGYGRIRISTR